MERRVASARFTLTCQRRPLQCCAARRQVRMRVAEVPIRSLRQSVIVIQGSADRKSVVEGKSVSVRVDRGGRRIITNNSKDTYRQHYTKTSPIFNLALDT